MKFEEFFYIWKRLKFQFSNPINYEIKFIENKAKAEKDKN